MAGREGGDSDAAGVAGGSTGEGSGGAGAGPATSSSVIAGGGALAGAGAFVAGTADFTGYILDVVGPDSIPGCTRGATSAADAAAPR